MNLYLASTIALCHHGIKGQKWGVKNGPPYPLKKNGIAKTAKRDKIVTYGHKSTPKRGKPNSILDHVGDDGTIDSRAFYNDKGWLDYSIHTADHGNAKMHPYGQHGEHIHYFDWDYSSGNPNSYKTDEIPTEIRKENQDIL